MKSVRGSTSAKTTNDIMSEAQFDLVVVGAGAAGLNAVAACRARYPEKRIALVDAETEVGYYRTLLPMFMSGKLPEDKLFFWRPDNDANLHIRLGMTVRSLDRSAKRLMLENGDALTYQRLILAQGGRPVVPPVFERSVTPEGVFPVRSLAVAREIKAWLPEHRDIVVLGGGLVGSKSSVFLRLAGFSVTLVEREAHILPTVLSANTARPLQRHLEAMGIRVCTGTTVDQFKADEKGAVAQVRLATGEWIPCGTFLVGIGSTPQLGFVKDTDLLHDGKLVVSPTLQTIDAAIFAVGDAIAIRTADGSRAYPWTWPQAVSQGKLAGINVFRDCPLPLKRTTRVNAQNIAGVPIMILGGPGVGSHVESRPGPNDGVWREFFMEENRIVGGALVGDIAGAGPLHFTMANGESVAERAADLLMTHTRAIRPTAWNRLNQDLRARSFFVKGNGP
jgi:NADPH-dependent 2,4-dienoyl-CoA reductase/sulfur reductase-like enzyme